MGAVQGNSDARLSNTADGGGASGGLATMLQ